jgi:hypothetical protein
MSSKNDKTLHYGAIAPPGICFISLNICGNCQTSYYGMAIARGYINLKTLDPISTKFGLEIFH